MSRVLAALSLGILLSACGLGLAGEPESPLGRQIGDFALQDFRGKSHRLSNFSDAKAVVLAFLGTECPLAKLYSVRLNELAAKYAERGVVVLGIDSNQQDSITEMAAHARIHELSFPFLKDVGNKVADAVGAVRTPSVFLLDADRRVCYHGRIDDQYGIGFAREEPKRHDLAEAIEELLAGEKIAVARTEAIGCFIGRVHKPNPDSTVTYSNQISRLLNKYCVECHRPGEIAPFALTDYDEVAGWAETIAEVVHDRRMPPWHASGDHGEFANERRMTDQEKQLIYEWAENGAPEGDRSQLPPAPTYISGWQIPEEPDQIISMRDEPFTVPAEGVVRYQYFSVDPGFTQDKWVKMSEVQPGNRAVVHHILVFIRRPLERFRGDGLGGGTLGAYVPGHRAEAFPAGMAKRVPAGSTLIFQVHYTPNGSVQEDRSRIGLVFADPTEVTHEIRGGRAMNRGILIPPGKQDYRVEATTTVSRPDAILLSLMPHMHLRGKSFRYEATWPGGEKEVLLDVPHYDFNWQTSYRLAKPAPLPRGTRIHCVAHFDNSDYNLANPDPTATVRWGDQTWNEMMIGFYQYAVPVAAQTDGGDTDAVTDAATARAQRLLDRYDQDGDGKVAVEEVPLKLRPVVRRIDANNDGHVTLEELRAALPSLRAAGR